MNKIETMHSFVEYWSVNTLDFNQLTDEEVETQLSTIKGIGKWTKDIILLYTLQRPNVFPYDDFHLKEIMVKLYGLNPNVKLKAQMLEVAEKWGSQKSLAVLYLLETKKSKML
jgi:DNA-3-methyladenine glycosylase II